MRRKYKKIITIMFMIVVVLLILLLILIIVRYNLKKKNSIQLSGDRHYIENFEHNNSVFDVYNGKVSSSKINNKVQFIFTVMLPEMYENVNQKTKEEIIEYFKNDQERISYVMGITTSEEFVEFIEKALKIDCDFSEYKSLTYVKGSYNYNDDEEIIKLIIKYKNSKSLNCIMHINPYSIDKVDARIEIE